MRLFSLILVSLIGFGAFDGFVLDSQAKKKRNKRRNTFKSVKTTAKTTKKPTMQEQSQDRIDSLGTPDNESARYGQQIQNNINRLTRQKSQEKRFLAALQSRLFNGSDINAKDASGRTYLHAAVLNGFPEAVAYLMKSGADTGVKDQSGLTPLQLAQSMKLEKMVAILKDKKKK